MHAPLFWWMTFKIDDIMMLLMILIDDIISAHEKEKLQLLLTNLSNYNLDINFAYEFDKEHISWI